MSVQRGWHLQPVGEEQAAHEPLDLRQLRAGERREVPARVGQRRRPPALLALRRLQQLHEAHTVQAELERRQRRAVVRAALLLRPRDGGTCGGGRRGKGQG